MHNLYAPPVARVDDVGVESGFELAARKVRCLAALIDISCMIFLTSMVLFFFNGVRYYIDVSTALVWKAALGVSVPNLLACWALNGYLLARRGQTVGKKLLGIKIVMADGSVAPFWRTAGLRLVPFVLGGVGPVGAALLAFDGLLILGHQRRCLHDFLAGTIVVKA